MESDNLIVSFPLTFPNLQLIYLPGNGYCISRNGNLCDSIIPFESRKVLINYKTFRRISRNSLGMFTFNTSMKHHRSSFCFVHLVIFCLTFIMSSIGNISENHSPNSKYMDFRNVCMKSY